MIMENKSYYKKMDILNKLCEETSPYVVVEWLGKSNKKLKNRRPSKFFISNNLKPIIDILDLEIKRLSRKK